MGDQLKQFLQIKGLQWVMNFLHHWGCFVNGRPAHSDILLTLAVLCLFVLDLCEWEGLSLFLRRSETISVIFSGELSHGLLFRLKCESKSTLSPPSVLRVLFMISSRRWKKREDGIRSGKFPMAEPKLTLFRVCLYIYMHFCNGSRQVCL